MWSEERRHRREREDRVRQEQHQAFVDLVQAGRRVQRVLVDLEQDPSSKPLEERLGQELDRLTESVATVRLVVTDQDVVAAAEAFEDKAKEFERRREWRREDTLRLSPLINLLQKHEAQDGH